MAGGRDGVVAGDGDGGVALIPRAGGADGGVGEVDRVLGPVAAGHVGDLVEVELRVARLIVALVGGAQLRRGLGGRVGPAEDGGVAAVVQAVGLVVHDDRRAVHRERDIVELFARLAGEGLAEIGFQEGHAAAEAQCKCQHSGEPSGGKGFRSRPRTFHSAGPGQLVRRRRGTSGRC